MVYAHGHIWKLFFIIMATGIMMLGAVTYNLWNQLNIKYTLEQENITTVN